MYECSVITLGLKILFIADTEFSIWRTVVIVENLYSSLLDNHGNTISGGQLDGYKIF